MLVHSSNFIESLLSNNTKCFTLKWNWGYVLVFVFIWSYGFEKVVFPLPQGLSLVLTGLLALIMVLFLFMGEKYKIFYEEKISITCSDLIVLGFLFVFFGVFSINCLSNALVVDQLYHAQAAQSQTIFIVNKLISRLKLPLDLEYKFLLEIINLVLLAGMAACICLIKKVNIKIRVILLVTGFILLRLFPYNIYSDPHPPFRLFPLWLNSTILSLSDFSFRSVSLFALVIFAFILYRYGQDNFNHLNSLLISMAVSSIPLLWHVGTLVEQSIWTALCWTLILLFLQKDWSSPKYVRWISLISIASLMRASAFVALIPIFMIAVYDYLRSKKYTNVLPYFIYAVPVLVLLPFLLKTLIVGTPSTTGQAASMAKILLSFQDWFSLRVMFYNVLFPWALFLPFFLIAKKNNWFNILINACFFMAAYFIFYTIDKGFWGAPRYQAELWIPFVILGFYKVAVFLYQRFPAYNRYLKFILILLIAFNSLIFTHLNWLNPPVDTWVSYFKEARTGKIKILADGEGVFEINEALQQVRVENLSKNMCKVGYTYGAFNEILNGYNIAEIKIALKYYNQFCVYKGVDVQNINNNQDIKIILFIEKFDHKLIKQFLDSGQWIYWKQFHNDQYGSTVVGLQRKAP